MLTLRCAKFKLTFTEYMNIVKNSIVKTRDGHFRIVDYSGVIPQRIQNAKSYANFKQPTVFAE